MPDERFDQLLRGSLDWQANRVAAARPTLRQATGRLADRLERRGGGARQRLSLVPATAASVNFWTLLLVLLALVAALIIGSQPPAPEPPPQLRFGYPIACPIERQSGLAFDSAENQQVMMLFAPDGDDADAEDDLLALYADGRFVHDISNPGESRADTITGARLAVRHLAPSGVERMLRRVSDAELTPGCRRLSTEALAGGLTAWTAAGPTELSWGPESRSLSVRISAADEAALGELVTALAQPETWLPADSWLDPDGRTIEPDHWLITLTFRPSGHEPGDTVELLSGMTLVGSDHRPKLLPLPGGAAAEAFGAELPLDDPDGPGSSIRCGTASLDEAVALASELEVLANGEGLGTDSDTGDVFTEDLTRSIQYSIQPIYGSSYDCGSLAADRGWMAEPTLAATPVPVVGDLATVDPCSLVSAAAVAGLGADASEERPARLPLGVPARACVVFDSNVPTEDVEGLIDPLPGGFKARITLYPISVDAETAGDVVGAAFGDGRTAGSIGGQPAWILVDCGPDELFCRPVVATWSGSRLIVIELVGPENMQMAVERVLAGLP